MSRTDVDYGVAGNARVRITLRFHGGAKDGIEISGSPQAISEAHGYRYYLLAMNCALGAQYREVPISESWVLIKAVGSYTAIRDISHEEIDCLAHELHELKTHIYEVTRRKETSDRIVIDLTFVREDAGI